MKNFKLILLLVPAFAMGLTEAKGGGKMFGATFGGTLLGTTLGNAFSRPSNTVVVTENSDSRLTNRAVRQLNGDMEVLFDNQEKLRVKLNKAVEVIEEQAEKITTLEKEVRKLKKGTSYDDVVETKKANKRSKKHSKEEEEETPKKKSTGWFSSSSDTTEESED